MKRAALIFMFFLPLASGGVFAQSPSTIYTWDDRGNPTGDIETWVKNFGANSVTLDNTVPGELRITETGTAGDNIAISDGANRVRESSVAASGGLDLTGIEFLEFELGHSGTGPIDVQFFVQASPDFTYIALGPDVGVMPGVATYQFPLAGLTPEQAVYIRTLGFNARDHLAEGNVTWTLQEVRSTGASLTTRTLVSHDTFTAEGGLQGAIVNFDVTAVQGNDGGQNQTGLSHNPAGSGSLQWTDLGGQAGAAISWGNGTAWNGNSFNNRTTDLSNYAEVIFRISALELVPDDLLVSVGVQAFFQKNNFQFEAADLGALQALPTDGAFHDLSFSLAGLSNMDVVDVTGINLASHTGDLLINIDSITFIPEPSVFALFGLGAAGLLKRPRISR